MHAQPRGSLHLLEYLCVWGYSRGTRLLGSRSPPTPCVPFAEEFQFIPKQEAISDDGFASSSQLPGYDRIPGRREGIHVEGWGSPPSPRPPHAPSGGVPLGQGEATTIHEE